MAVFRQGDIVRVPFPYTDRPTRKGRPALVVSNDGLGPDGRLIWVAIITSAENRAWQGDVALADHETCGLPVASVVRPAKIATIEASEARLLGHLSPGALSTCLAAIARKLR